jgi:hypothetical protein
MIIGSHFLLYSKDADADRAFFKDVLQFPWVDAGEGWLIFGMSPAEMGVHPAEGEFSQQHAASQLLGAVLYLMCDDLKKTIAELVAKKVRCSQIEEAPWGNVTTISLPSGGSIGLYQPRHATALTLRAKSKSQPKLRPRARSKSRSK